MTVKPARALSGTAFATLLLIALMMGSNHVAARFAFNNGVDVATAVTVRSFVTAAVVSVLFLLQGARVRLTGRHKGFMLAIGLLIGVQSICLYSGVARLPVVLALLAFNTYPLWTAIWNRIFYGHQPERATLIAMPFILVGLCMALDLDGRLRTASTMGLAGVVALGMVATQGGFHLPQAAAGWWGLAALTFLYGTAFTIMFTVLPKLGVAGNSAIMNVEPVCAMVLAWLLLGQSIAPMQVAGALLVVGTVMALGLRKR